MTEVEEFFSCPYCFERISMLLDISVEGTQTYVEDCEVCCRPIQLTYSSEQGELQNFEAERAQ